MGISLGAFCGVSQGVKCAIQLTNHRLVMSLIFDRWHAAERWRAVRKSPTPVIGQKKCVVKCVGTPDSPRSNLGPQAELGAHLFSRC